MPEIAAFDWIALLVLAASTVMGLWRGVLYEVVALAGWVCAFIAARLLAEPLAQALPMQQLPPGLRQAIAMAIVFAVVVFMAGFVAWQLRRAARAAGVRGADSALGGMFGALRALALLALAAVLLVRTPLAASPWWQGSISQHWLQPWLPALQALLPPLPGWQATVQSTNDGARAPWDGGYGSAQAQAASRLLPPAPQQP